MKLRTLPAWISQPIGSEVDVSEEFSRWLIKKKLAKAIRQAPRDKMCKSGNKSIASGSQQ